MTVYSTNIKKTKKRLNELLSGRSEILFGYLHGSVLYSNKPNDLDIALFLNPKEYEKLFIKGELSMEYAIPLEQELERKMAIGVDVQILNQAPLPFRYSVVSQGELIVDTNRNVRSDFEYLSRVEYFDFRPKREEYLREAFSL